MHPRTATSTLTLPGTPFVKWPGGKRWLTPFLLHLLQKRPIRSYFEPFLGGAALFFALRPDRAYLSDINAELINAYVQVRDNHERVAAVLRTLPVTAEDFYKIRARRRRSPILRAVDFLYLNRTAYGGVYRVNRSGMFNVPYGGGERTPRLLHETDLLFRAAAALQPATLDVCDFEASMRRAGDGDVIYCDPTYTVAHNNNGFIRYNERNFSWQDQRRLAETARDVAKVGATVVISNAHHADLIALHRGATCHLVTRRSLLAKQPCHRREVIECVFVYPPQ